MKIEDLLKALHLPLSAPNDEQLEQLKAWCMNNVSRDLHFEGSIEQQYAQYAELAATYRTFTEINLPDVATPNPKLGQLSAIQFAAMRGFDVYLERLELTPHQINQPMLTSSNTPLHLAASGGHLFAARECIKKGARLDVLDNQGNTPAMKSLMLSGFSRRDRREQLFEELRSSRDLLTHHNASGNTVFHLAAQFGFRRVLEQLIEKHPEGLLQQNSDHHYPMQLAIRQVGDSKETVELLLAHPEVMRAVCDYTREVPLHDAARYVGDDMLTEAFIVASLAAGVSLDVKNKDGETPLELASAVMNKDMVTALIRHGVNLTREDIIHAHEKNRNLAFSEWMLQQQPTLDPHIIDELKERYHASSYQN